MDNGTRDACPCCNPTFGIQSDKYGALQEHRCREEWQMALSAGANGKTSLLQQILAALKDRWNMIKAGPPCKLAVLRAFKRRGWLENATGRQCGGR